MKVRLIFGRATADSSNAPGDVIDVPEAEGYALIETGNASPVEPEAAVQAPAERATKPRPRARKRPSK